MVPKGTGVPAMAAACRGQREGRCDPVLSRLSGVKAGLSSVQMLWLMNGHLNKSAKPPTK
jgi:hypothetical protein